MKDDYPQVVDPAKVGEYPAVVKAGGGYVWDAVLEYRVWCHPHEGADDADNDGSDYYYAFDNYAEALAFSESTKVAEKPLALIRRNSLRSPSRASMCTGRKNGLLNGQWNSSSDPNEQREQFQTSCPRTRRQTAWPSLEV